MPDDRTHHMTKKRFYNILLVPSDDAGKTRGMRLAPWQMAAGVVGAVTLIVAAVLSVLIYTPLGPLVPISNPELEHRYNQELLSLNERLSDVMQQLIELRTYNVKLRQALGENVQLTDSGLVSAGPKKQSRAVPQQQAQGRVHTVSPPPVRSFSSPAVERTDYTGRSRAVLPVIMPTDGYITRGFDPNQRHFGLDIAGKTGTPVHAAAEGFVVFAGWTNEDGYMLILSHPDGYLTFYKHNQSLLVAAHRYVQRGEPIALLGDTGITSAGPHLHFEIWKDGAPVDPANYMVNVNF